MLCIVITELGEKGGWYKYDYYHKYDASLDMVNDTVARVDAHAMSAQEFRFKYERTYTPVVISNSQTSWQANEKWTLHVSILLHITTLLLTSAPLQ